MYVDKDLVALATQRKEDSEVTDEEIAKLSSCAEICPQCYIKFIPARNTDDDINLNNNDDDREEEQQQGILGEEGDDREA